MSSLKKLFQTSDGTKVFAATREDERELPDYFPLGTMVVPAAAWYAPSTVSQAFERLHGDPAPVNASDEPETVTAALARLITKRGFSLKPRGTSRRAAL